jgi:serine/threonine-protein kinase PknG
MEFPAVDRAGNELPWPDNHPVLLDNESLKLFLDRACAHDPALRFQSADEMFEQLFGVLREVVCLDSGEPKPAVSDRFIGDGLAEPDEQAVWKPIAASLPRLRPDSSDSAAGALMAAASLKGDKLAQVLEVLRQQFPRSKELAYAEIELAVSRGNFTAAQQAAGLLLQADPYDWKAWFLQGRIAFLQDDFKLAAERFARIRAELPGEPAAQMALALALESYGEPTAAEAIYDRVSKADPSYASASFGLVRCRLSAGDRGGAVQALKRIPSTSALYVAAQMAIVRVLLADLPDQAPGAAELGQAAEVYTALAADGQAAHLLAADLLLKAAEQIEGGNSLSEDLVLLGWRATARELRQGAEQSLRRAARFATDKAVLYALVDRANQVRPRTFF